MLKNSQFEKTFTFFKNSASKIQVDNIGQLKIYVTKEKALNKEFVNKEYVKRYFQYLCSIKEIPV